MDGRQRTEMELFLLLRLFVFSLFLGFFFFGGSVVLGGGGVGLVWVLVCIILMSL